MLEKVRRLFKFEGSYLFVSHACMVVIMCVLHTLMFLRIPFIQGNWAINTMNLQDIVDASQIKTFVTILCGYCLNSMLLLILHTYAIIVGNERLRNITGQNCIVLKVRWKYLFIKLKIYLCIIYNCVF